MENQEFTQLEQLKDELIGWLQTLKDAKSDKERREHEANFHAFLEESFLDGAELLEIIDNLDDEMLGILLYFLPVDWVLKMLLNGTGEQIKRIMPLLDNAAYFIGLLSPKDGKFVLEKACGKITGDPSNDKEVLDCRMKLYSLNMESNTGTIIEGVKESLSKILDLRSLKEIFSRFIRRAMFLARE